MMKPTGVRHFDRHRSFRGESWYRPAATMTTPPIRAPVSGESAALAAAASAASATAKAATPARAPPPPGKGGAPRQRPDQHVARHEHPGRDKGAAPLAPVRLQPMEDEDH